MDWGWANAASPIAVVALGWWMKRSAETRNARLLAASAAAKVAADGAAALARENLAKAILAKDQLNVIEGKVDGTLSQAVRDLATAREEIKRLSIGWTDFQAKADRFLQTGTGAKALAEVIAAPISAGVPQK